MSATMDRAARVNDGIAHHDVTAWAVAGLVGGVVVAAFIVTAPVAATAVAETAGILGVVSAFFGGTATTATLTVVAQDIVGFGIATMISGIGDGIGGMGGRSIGGLTSPDKITTGLSSVLIGSERWSAARITSEVDCHSETIISGVKNIFIGDQLATRVGEKTRCDGRVGTGCDTVLFGGESVEMGSVRVEGELNSAFYWVRFALGLPSALVGLFQFAKEFAIPTGQVLWQWFKTPGATLEWLTWKKDVVSIAGAYLTVSDLAETGEGLVGGDEKSGDGGEDKKDEKKEEEREKGIGSVIFPAAADIFFGGKGIFWP